MNEAETKVAIFRACATALLNMNFSPDEARAASAALRQGDITMRLATMLDGLIPVPLGERLLGDSEQKSKISKVSPAEIKVDYVKKTTDNSPLKIFEDVKRRKITKGQLFSLFQQVNPSVARDIDLELSMREAIAKFREKSTRDDWDFLAGIIQGASQDDAYLLGMTGR